MNQKSITRLDLENAEKPDIKLPTSVESSKKQKSSRKTSTSALLTMPKPLTVWITTNWKILKEMRILDHLTCLLRNRYACQEATVRTGHGTTDSFQIGKGVNQGCILSLCLLNLDAEYIMWSRQWHPTPVFLPGESQGRGSLVGCHLWGHTESDTTEVT